MTHTPCPWPVGDCPHPRACPCADELRAVGTYERLSLIDPSPGLTAYRCACEIAGAITGRCAATRQCQERIEPGSNAPPFDPLNATREEEVDMVRGYRDGRNGRPEPPITSMAYDHGRRNAVSDRTKILDDDQRALARRYLQQQRRD